MVSVLSAPSCPVVPTPEPVHDMAASLEPHPVMAATSEPCHSAIMDAISVFPVIMNFASEAVKPIHRCMRLASSLEDTPLVLVQAVSLQWY